MNDREYIHKVASMLYHFNAHRILSDRNSEYFDGLSKLPQSSRYHKAYQIFSGGSQAKSPGLILSFIKLQLGIYPGGEPVDYLLDFDKEKTLDWFSERHRQYKFLQCGVYWVLCNTTHDVYIGSSQNIQRRLSAHRCHLNSFTHRNARLQALWLKYGEKDFEFKTLRLTVDYRSYEKAMINKLGEYMPVLNTLQHNHRKGFSMFSN